MMAYKGTMQTVYMVTSAERARSSPGFQVNMEKPAKGSMRHVHICVEGISAWEEKAH